MSKHMDRFMEYARYKADVLLNKVDFKKDVISIRSKWRIPSDGLTDDSQVINWHNDMKVMKYIPSQADINLERARMVRSKIGSPSESEANKLFNVGTPIINAERAFGNDLGALLKEYGLSYLWFSCLKTYVLTGEMKRPPTELSYRQDVDEASGHNRMTIAITPQTTKEDLMAMMPSINEWQKNFASIAKQRSVPGNYERDKNMYSAYVTTGDIKAAKALHDQPDLVTDDEAHKIVSRIKQKFTSKIQY